MSLPPENTWEADGYPCQAAELRALNMSILPLTQLASLAI